LLCLALVAEVVKHYHPNLVDLHNYPAAQAVGKKTTNWNILNRLHLILCIGQMVMLLFMVALWNRADHIYFHAVVCSFFLYGSSFFSSPNLSRRRLDVCHTSTHGVALVRI